MSTETQLNDASADVLKAMLEHFADMPARMARWKINKLRGEIYAALADVGAGHVALGGVPTEDGREAELYRKLDSLYVSTLTPPGRSVRGRADLWSALWTIFRLVRDICWVLEHSGKKTLAEVLAEKRNRLNYDSSFPGPFSRLIDLWESESIPSGINPCPPASK